MSLLNTYEVQQKIAQEVASATTHLQIVSAFCKVDAVEFIDRDRKSVV